jgi:cell division protein FtsB
MMNAEVISPQAVQVDGQNYGNVADAIANNPQLAASIQTALNDWFLALQAEHQSALEALQTQVSGEAALQAANETLTQQVQALQAELNDFRNPPQPAHDWNAFRRAMMTDRDYQRMLITVMAPEYGGQGNWLGTTMQQAISMSEPSLPLVKPLWNQIVRLAPPSLEAVQRWRENVSKTNVPIVFTDEGALSEGT